MLVQVTQKAGRSREIGRKICDCVHRAIAETLDASSKNQLQIVNEQTADFVNHSSKSRAANEQTDQVAIILIYMPARYSNRKKRALFGRIGDLLIKELGINPQDVVIGLIDMPSGNWSFGYNEAELLEMLAYQLP